MNVWIGIGLTSFFAGTALCLTSSKKMTYKNILSKTWHFVKAYLEQGGPFPENANQTSNFIAFASMLAATVLSNAYKNANVYNLVLPRPVLPLTDLTELLANNFSIYVRPSYIFLDISFAEHIDVKGSLNTTGLLESISAHRLKYSFGLATPTHRSDLMIESEVLVGSQINPYKTTTRNGLYITEFTKLLPIRKYVYNRTLGIRKSKVLLTRMMDYESKLFEFTDVELFKKLKTCQKTAALVSNIRSNWLAQNLKSENLQNVFVGKDRYLEVNHGFFIKGKITRNIVKRIQAIQFSGIWEWLPKYASEMIQFPTTYERQVLEKPKMDGNIQVIFFIWLCGVVAGLVVFNMEMWKPIFALVVLILNFMDKLCKTFYRIAKNILLKV